MHLIFRMPQNRFLWHFYGQREQSMNSGIRFTLTINNNYNKGGSRKRLVVTNFLSL